MEIGRGGEGRVFELPGEPDLVAKVYRHSASTEKALKLSAMVRLKTDRLLRLAAWPVDVISERPGGPVRGLVMPRVREHKDIHKLYSPKSRLAEFKDANWAFLVHTAANVARAFAVIHEHGHVVADVNHGNVVVSPHALVRLIDCDSFQITADGRQFLSEVGVSTHTPPELQGMKLRGIVRSANHDAFGLAVLVFQLLFMGRHPFSGQYVGGDEMSLERAIQEHRFAYGAGAAGRHMRAPPATLHLRAMPVEVSQLFERAFSPSPSTPAWRPTAREWEAALAALEKQLIRCGVSGAHEYWKGLRACPWCSIEELSKVRLFVRIHPGVGTARAFKLEVVWQAIAAVPSPGIAPTLAEPRVGPSGGALRKMPRGLLRVGGAIVVVGATLAGLIRFQVATAPLWLVGAVWLVVGAVLFAGSGPGRAAARDALRAAERRWQQVRARWGSEATDVAFRTKARDLEGYRTQYVHLPALRRRREEALVANAEQQARQRFLDSHSISTASIRGIGAGRKATLQSWGVETAADVDWEAVRRVPGFGDVLTESVVQWRRRVESSFRFDPRGGADPRDRAAMEAELSALQAKLESELGNGAAALREIGRRTIAARQTLRPAVEQAWRVLAQARADYWVTWW